VCVCVCKWVKPKKIDFEPRHRKKGRSRAGKREQRRQGVIADRKRADIRRSVQQRVREQHANSDVTSTSVLDRFHRQTSWPTNILTHAAVWFDVLASHMTGLVVDTWSSHLLALPNMTVWLTFCCLLMVLMLQNQVFVGETRMESCCRIVFTLALSRLKLDPFLWMPIMKTFSAYFVVVVQHWSVCRSVSRPVTHSVDHAVLSGLQQYNNGWALWTLYSASSQWSVLLSGLSLRYPYVTVLVYQHIDNSLLMNILTTSLHSTTYQK